MTSNPSRNDRELRSYVTNEDYVRDQEIKPENRKGR